MRQPHARNSASLSICGQHDEDAGRAEEAERRAELREHAVPALLAARRVLGREQHGAAPFAAEAQALAEPAEREQRRRRDADRGVGRQQADRDGRQAHRQQRRDERRLAPDAVAEVAEQRRADGPREERERERRERLQRRGRRDRRPGRTAAGTRAPRPCRRCRNRRTRSSCRSSSRTARGPSSLGPGLYRRARCGGDLFSAPGAIVR